MIQRIQTLFLFLAAACFAILFKAPMATSDKPTAQFLSDQVYTIQDHIALLGLTILGAVMALVTIFLYTNRKLQIKLGFGVMLTGIVLSLVSFLFLKNDPVSLDSTAHVKDQWGMFIPLVSVLLVVLANHFIRKDDQLVKSMDRLR
jgi:uncharacterized membrane protein